MNKLFGLLTHNPSLLISNLPLFTLHSVHFICILLSPSTGSHNKQSFMNVLQRSHLPSNQAKPMFLSIVSYEV